jgi:hypothetical protein
VSELIAFVLASVPLVAFVALVVETIRVGTAGRNYPSVNLLHRAYGA